MKKEGLPISYPVTCLLIKYMQMKVSWYMPVCVKNP